MGDGAKTLPWSWPGGEKRGSHSQPGNPLYFLSKRAVAAKRNDAGRGLLLLMPGERTTKRTWKMGRPGFGKYISTAYHDFLAGV
jgi:hypothetical protein